MSLPNTLYQRQKTSVEPGSMPYDSILVAMPKPGPSSMIAVTKPSLHGYKFDGLLSFISFLTNEGAQILGDIDGRERCKPIKYDFYTSLASIMDSKTMDIKKELKPDGTVIDPEVNKKHNEQRHQETEGYDELIVAAFGDALDEAANFNYDPEQPDEGIEVKESENKFFITKNLFAQYVAVCQARRDYESIQNIVGQMAEIFNDKKGLAYSEMQEFVGIAYKAVNEILQLYINEEVAYLEKIGIKGDSFELRAGVTQTFIAVEKGGEAAKAQISRPVEIGRIVEIRALLQNLAEDGYAYYSLSQGPEVDAIRAQVGYCVITQDGEKVGVPNLESLTSLVIVNKKEIREGDKIIAKKGAMCTTILAANNAKDIPEIFAHFLRIHPGLTYNDLGVYIVGGKLSTKPVLDFIKTKPKPKSEIFADDKLLRDAANDETIVVLKNLLDFLQEHDVAIDGSCIYNPRQPNAFIVAPDAQGKVQFSLGRPKEVSPHELGTDFLGMCNYHNGLANIIYAPGLERKRHSLFIAPQYFDQARQTMYCSQESNFVSIVTASGKFLTRNFPVIHMYGQSYERLVYGVLEVSLVSALTSFQRHPLARQMLTAQGAVQAYDVVKRHLTKGAVIAAFVNDPVPDAENAPILKPLAMPGRAIRRSPKGPVLHRETMEEGIKTMVQSALSRTTCSDPNTRIEQARRDIALWRTAHRG